jgi:molybdate transport system substrate-binding protein
MMEVVMKHLFIWMVLAMSMVGAQAQTLIVSAASSLTNAFTEMGSLFETQNSGVAIRFNFASSGTLLQQISQGAPADVLATADTNSMNRAQDAKLIEVTTRTTFIENQLVLITPARSSLNLTSLDDLNNSHITRIAIGNPNSVPAGLYAKKTLESSHLWQRLVSKLIMAQNVRQATLYVSQNEVDAGFVFLTDANAAGKAVNVAFVVNTPSTIAYPAAIVTGTTQPEIAQNFIHFLKSDAAQGVFTRYGFKSVAQ